jgi:hypothetical protein
MTKRRTDVHIDHEAFDHMSVEAQDTFLLAIGLAMVECAIDELDRQDAAAAAAVAPTPADANRRAG